MRPCPPLLRIALLPVLCALGLAVMSCREGRPTVPLAESAYVWQRAWTPAVVGAVTNAPAGLERLVVLAAQVGWQGGRPVPVRVAFDAAALRSAGPGIGLALRVSPCPGPLPPGGGAVSALVDLARAVVDDARSQGLSPVELQVDYDCPERRLDEYADWVVRLRAAVQPVPVRITVLPSWLRQPACRRLLGRVDGAVVQVHWLQDRGGERRLLDVAEARAAVRAMARLGVPFDVALPTYAYLAARGDGGRLLGISAEGPLPNWPRSARLGRVRSEPAQVATLVREWSARRPAAMGGVIWYRLPVEGDALNWAPVTWARVRRGEVPRADLRALLEWRDRSLADVVVTNAGDDEAALAGCCLALESRPGRVEACDGVGGFAVRPAAAGGLTVSAGEGTPAAPLRPGERRTVGWVRVGAAD